MLSQDKKAEIFSCILRQFPDSGLYLISRVTEWLSTNGYSMEKLGYRSFSEFALDFPEAFKLQTTPDGMPDTYVIIKSWHCKITGAAEHPADSFFGSSSIILNDDIIEMSQQSLYALTMKLENGYTVQQMKARIFEAFAQAKENGTMNFLAGRYIFPIDYCKDGFLINGIITKNNNPSGKSLYFAFAKTEIFRADNQAAVVEPSAPAVTRDVPEEDKREIYRLLTSNFGFGEQIHMAAVSKLLSDNGYGRTRYGFSKMKELLRQLDYLKLDDVVMNGVPQILVTIMRKDGLPAPEARFGAAEKPFVPVQNAAPTHTPASAQWYTPVKENTAAETTPERNDRPAAARPIPPYSYVERPAEPRVEMPKETRTPAASGEPVIPTQPLSEFCNLPSRPIAILSAYLTGKGLTYSFSELMAAICEDFDLARRNGCIRFFENKMIFPIRFKRDDDTPVELTLKPSSYEGLPWFLYYVDTVPRKTRRNESDPGRQLENFAFLGSWQSFLTELADKALDEEWDFESSPYKNKQILIQYIKYTFYRLTRENKVCISSDNCFAAFNTGLVDKHYEDIYACFLPNEDSSETKWKFEGFCTAASRGLGKSLVDYFNPLPQPPRYYTKGEELIFDHDKQLHPDFNHIIIDNIRRLPLQFLRDQVHDEPTASAIIGRIMETTDYHVRNTLYSELQEHLMDNSRLFIRIQNRIKDAIELARKRVQWNYKTAIPSYFPKRDTMSLMLPLALIDDSQPDVALVVELKRSGNYQGQTIITMPQAYIDARLLCRPNSEWLSTSVKTTSGDIDDIDAADDFSAGD